MIRSTIIMCLSHLMDKFKTFHSSSGRSLSIILILCPCWHLQIIIFFLRKIQKPKMTSFVKLAAITYLWLVWNKNGLVIVFIRKLIFCYMMIHLTVRINCTFLYSFMLRYICLCNWTPFLPNQPVAARGDEERDDSLIHHDNPRMWWSRMWWLLSDGVIRGGSKFHNVRYDPRIFDIIQA